MSKLKGSYVLVFAALFWMSKGWASAQESVSPPQQSAPPPTQAPAPVERVPAAAPQTQEPPPPAYDKAIFQKPIPGAQLAFLNQFAGVPSGDAVKDKQFHKAINGAIPDPMFHYGKDMPLDDALDMVLKGSPQPVQVRDGRYVIVSSRMGPLSHWLQDPHLAGRGFIWIDMQDGIVLGGFYFHPTNGEPTPSVTVFSKQIKEDAIGLSQLPPAFAEDLSRWSRQMSLPPVETRYFIGSVNKKILLEHDEDYCAPMDGVTAPDQAVCEQMDEDAADVDMIAASYLEQTHYATNATAYMITNPDQIAWLQVRDNTCRVGPDPLGCHIRMTHERTRVILHRSGPAPHTGPHR